MAEEERSFWRWTFEVAVFVVVVGGVASVCYWGCRNGRGRVSKSQPVVCPACGAKLELKEAGR